MFALLQWLYDRANRVYEFFGTLYWSIRNVALNAWTWVRNAINTAWEYATEKASNAFHNALAWVNTYIVPRIQDARNWAVDAYNKAVSALSTAGAWIENKAREIWAKVLEIKDWLIVQILLGVNRAIAGAKAIVDGVSAIWNNLVANVKRDLSNWINNVENKIELVKEELGLTDPEKQESFLAFVTDPVGWFAAYLISIFMLVLEFSLAYALGTTKGSLPPWPSFSVGGEGGPYPVSPGPSPDASGLAKPLTSLWRSGYRFRAGHRAIDFGCTKDQTVFASHSGKVVVSGWSNVGYGFYVVIQGGEWWSLYAHLSQPLVGEGQYVEASQPIGLCDCTGNSTCNHLHFELKHHGVYVDPGLIFGVG